MCELVEVQVGELHKPGQTNTLLLLLLLSLRKRCCMACGGVQQQPSNYGLFGRPLTFVQVIKMLQRS